VAALGEADVEDPGESSLSGGGDPVGACMGLARFAGEPGRLSDTEEAPGDVAGAEWPGTAREAGDRSKVDSDDDCTGVCRESSSCCHFLHGSCP
jgi:hypothetical protein